MTYRGRVPNTSTTHALTSTAPARRGSAKTRLFTAAATVAAMLVSLVATVVPANAAEPLPRVLLTGGAAQVSRTYTATISDDGEWPSHTELRYQWYRGDHDATADSFVPIQGAQGQSYKLTDDDHWSTIKVIVQAVDGSSVVAEKSSATTNWIMYNMAPPVLLGVPHVGQLITAKLGIWSTEWWTTLTWRRTSVPIPGVNGLSYRARPADAGKEISLLAYGEYEFANGVHPIDRYASWMRIRWATKSILRGTSPKRGVLRLTVIPYAAGANQSTVRGRVSLYDGQRRVARFWVPKGRKVVQLKGLRKGRHNMRMVFEQNPWFDASSGRRAFAVR